MLKSQDRAKVTATKSRSGTLKLEKAHALPDESMLLGLFKRHRMSINSPKIQLVRDALHEARDIIEPAAVWAVKDWREAEPHLTSHVPREILTRVEGLIGVVCTIGPALERRSRQYFEEHYYTLGYLLDQVGDFAVSILSQQVADIMAQEHDVARWGPGDTPEDRTFSSQRMLFDWIPAHEIGVSLSKHRMMIPTKSLSFFMLIGEELANVPCRIDCHQCVWQGRCRRSRGG